ncbi:MAG: pitrilysin family protein [Kofleriaceae bacterium]
MTAPIELEGEHGAPRLALDRFALPCGLDVIVHSDLSLPHVAVSVWYEVGAADERAGGSGLAHLFEHLFKNSAHLQGRHHYEILRSLGASDANASTGADRTSYHQVVPAHQLEAALWLEADRMGYFLPTMTEERLAAQQQVVLSERRQRYENVPYGADRLAVAAALYPVPHPLGHLVIGHPEHIAAVTLADVFDFYRTWYVPSNAHLTLAGAIEPGDARRLVERYFGSFPPSRAPGHAPAPEGDARAGELALVDGFARLERTHWAWRGPPARGPEATALEVLASAWATPGVGLLWRRLVYEEPLAQRVSAWAVAHRRGTELHVAVDVRGGVDLGRVEDVLQRELEAARDRPGDPVAVARVVRRREASALWALQSVARRAADLQRHRLWYGDPNGFARDAARFRGVTPEGIQRAAATWLGDGTRITARTRLAATG